eukprot:gnl/TRDRNA2_/TRDRNA2_181732_c0_seq1.p1 gnl/TRDRNA2_/TRDRNA2_181732_c0~~gnl/TRDRNA2_/TRDRNA2_181732_c0_seq1.p1  ORF type:complete len:301 (+),score=102.30 gnl/TRDRNA2_/TRDRNA2_181732_c0_seq1:121-1023(+)
MVLLRLIVVIAALGAEARDANVQRHLRAENWPIPGLDPGVPLGPATLKRAEEQYGIAEAANVEAEKNTKSMEVTQQELVSDIAKESGQNAYDEVLPAPPEARAAATEAEVWARDAAKYAAHAQQVEKDMRTVAEEAAAKAAAFIENQIKKDAFKAAEDTAKKQDPDRAKKIAAIAAAAAEPYHLALLRAQKATQVTYEKAKSAMDSAKALTETANQQAANAQAMQDAGMVVQANQMMLMAHTSMLNAEKMQGWAAKMYAGANQLNRGLGQYQLYIGMAAANAGATAVIDPAMKLPPPPPS